MNQHTSSWIRRLSDSKTRLFAIRAQSTRRRSNKLAVELLENRDLLSTLQFSHANYGAMENGGSATITVTRTGGYVGSATVDYATNSGTATTGSDYTATSGVLMFADGQTIATFSVPIIDDSTAEASETVNLVLSNVTGAATIGSPSSAVLTILDDDSPSPTVGAHTLAFAYFGSPPGVLSTNPIVTQSADSTVLAWVGRGDLSTLTAATAPTDNFGNSAVQLGTTNNYAPPYPDSGFALYNFPSFVGGNGNYFSAPMPVSDEVTLAVVEVKNGGVIQDWKYNRVENAPQTTLSVTTTGPATLISFWTGDSGAATSNAVPNNGFTLIESQTVSANAVQAAVATKDVSAAGTYNVTWTASPAQAALMYLIAVQYKPVLRPGLLQFDSTSYSVDENQGKATITVTRTGGSAGAVAVDYATSDGTAFASSDYTAASGTLTFADGQTSATFTVPIIDDASVEGNQTLNLTLTNATGGATLGTPAAATLTIVDNDTPAVQSVTVNDGNAQRSMVTTTSVTFNTEVVLGAGAFTLTRVGLPGGLPGDFATVGTVTVSTQVINGATLATLTFGGANTEFGSLKDGKWALTVDHTKVQAVNGGALMAVDFNQTIGHRLFGDANGDGSVAANDFILFRPSFNGINDMFDFNGDGFVSASDFVEFRNRFNLSI